jgi:6-phosphofructokinase 1
VGSTQKKIRRIGLMTGGGDCPGLNAVIRAITKSAILQHDISVIGIEDGFLGLIEDRCGPLDLSQVSNILTQGGTILGASNKANPSRYAIGKDASGQPIFKDVSDDAIGTIERHGIELLVCIGGDGTMTGSADFVRRGIPCVGVPKTIDNDLMHTELTFGFHTAVQTATEALDRIHTTASSHHRVMLVEMMGRNAGWLTLYSGVASGADVILLPEMPYRLQSICQTCLDRSTHGKRFTIIAVAEGARILHGDQVVNRVVYESPDPIRLGGISEVLADEISSVTGLETRATILGHVQRGGTPNAQDRVLGTLFGHAAMELVVSGQWNRMVALQDGELTHVPIESVAGQQRLVEPDNPLISAAQAVGVHFGERLEPSEADTAS